MPVRLINLANPSIEQFCDASGMINHSYSNCNIVLIILWHILHLAFAYSLRLHSPFQALCPSLPQGSMGNGLSSFLNNFCSALICKDNHWDERKSDRVTVKHHLYDFHHWVLHILQCFLHQTLDIYVSKLYYIALLIYRFVIEVVLHGIAIGFAGLECLLGAICIVFFFGE